MRRASMIWTATLCVVPLTSCMNTASGRALENRIGGSLNRLWRSSAALLSSDVNRTSRLVQVSTGFPLRPHARLAAIVTTTGNALQFTGARLQSLPRAIQAFAGHGVADSLTRLGRVGADSPLRRQLDPGTLAARWRQAWVDFFAWSDLARPVLAGPGDPDRSTDPDHVHRRSTFVERLLRRF